MATWLNFFAAPYKGYGTTIIQQVLVAIVIPLLAALLPIYNSVRITVREALSDYGLGGNAKAKEETTSQNLVFDPAICISLRSMFRRKTRLGLTLFTLVLGGAVFIAVYNLWASFDKTIEDIQGYFLADINISFTAVIALIKWQASRKASLAWRAPKAGCNTPAQSNERR